jgi:hypothetical protein
MAVVLDDLGVMRFEHWCTRAKRLADPGPALLIAPRLDLHVIQGPMETITISPSILCSDCGIHGFVTDGNWRSA